MLIPFKGKFLNFLGREESGYDKTVTDEIVLKEIFLENVYQVFEGDILDTGIVIDLGANIGAFSIYMASMGAKVYGYEPEKENFDMYKKNVEANGLSQIISCNNSAVSNFTGTDELMGSQGAAFLSGAKPHINLPSQTVNTITLASVFADNNIPYCDILKIDTEGSEYKILDCDSDVINKAKYITMEFHATDEITFGKMIAKLSLTHNTHIVGRFNYGGNIYAKRY